jgi:hypothetical protein
MDEFITYHGTRDPVPDITSFQIQDISRNPSGFHVGTKSQAEMRMHPKGSLLAIKISPDHLHHIARLKDTGGNWAPRLKRHIRQGRSILTYLNRWEDISAKRAQELAEIDTDQLIAMSDKSFRKLVPEAHDSWIILDPGIIESISLTSRTQRS